MDVGASAQAAMEIDALAAAAEDPDSVRMSSGETESTAKSESLTLQEMQQVCNRSYDETRLLMDIGEKCGKPCAGFMLGQCNCPCHLPQRS